MALSKPYRRTVRQLADDSYSNSGNGQYVGHPLFAESAGQYLRAFGILVKDYINLLDYIEPATLNENTYSFRIHELLLRACIEVESNFVAILKENGYQKKSNWNILDFKKVNDSHHLSSYLVLMPVWKGKGLYRNPFENWNLDSNLDWFRAYNSTKHDRHNKFERANFKCLTDAMCGLAVLIASQFRDYSFGSQDTLLSLGGPKDGMDILVGDFFRIKFPRDWTDEEKYGFKWETLKEEQNPIDVINYT